MASVLWVEEEQFDQIHPSHPGCMSGIFHVLDYHHWNSNVKKILSHRKHEAFIKHAKRNRRYQRISDDQDSFEVLKLLDDKTNHIQKDQRNQKTSSTQKRSLKARIKALVSEDQDSVLSPKLHRTYSIHHLESNEWVDPMEFFPESVEESPVSSKTQVNVNESRDIFDMFDVDKELFINTLQDRSHSSVFKQKLTKSGSFPTAYKLDDRSLVPMKLKDKLNESYSISKSGKMKNLNDDVNSNNIIRLRRIFSLNGSADRYTQLFDFSVNKETALRSSRSLNLTNGSESVLSARQPSLFRKNDPNQESYDAYLLRSFSQNERNLVSAQDCESLNEVIHKNDNFSENKNSPEANSLAFGDDSHALTIEKHDHRILEEITPQSPVLVHEYCPSDAKVQILEGLDLSINDDDFTYVKKILERSGFLNNAFQQTWYSTHQPLDPLLFQELESQYLHDPARFAEEVNELSHRLLIFDLVDEVLRTMYERSSTYYPKKLSFCHIRPAPTGPLVLDEVWNRMSRMINLKHDMYDTLNDIVCRDLGSDDGWMNLQVDSEGVGLDLEDLILDEVLKDLLFEFI